jgi:thioredoxin 2
VVGFFSHGSTVGADDRGLYLGSMSNQIVPCPSCGTKNRVPAAAPGTPRCANCKEGLPWLIEAGDGDFEQAVSTKRLVLVDLWAPWCGPCVMVAPMLEKMSQEFASSLKVVKVNVDESPQIAQKYNASSIPMLLFMRGGELIDTVIGAQPEHLLRGRIETLLAQ